jgi:citronellol/citronellal dehydrogenase
MRGLSIEWARHGIVLNAIAAGQIATDTFMTKYPQQLVEAAAQAVPVQRLGRAEDIAWLVAHLASPAGDFVSGAVLTVDGARDNWSGAWPSQAEADAQGRPVAEERRGPAPP